MPRPATFHRTAQVEDIDIFYREAGQPGSPAIVLLHGFPSSSHMYRNLMPELADRYHVIAPDLPGFGLSAMPPPERFEYSFAHFARILAGLLAGLGIERHALYVMDYGAPVGFRLALDRPDKISALVVQNGNAYEEGMGPFWDLTRAYWADPGPANRNAMRPFLEPAGTRFQYLAGVQDAERIDPAAWLYDQIFLDRPGSTEIQLDIIYDYRTNVALYPAIHKWLRATRPPTLILWGEDDPIFLAAGARAYLRDVPKAELHYLRTGHFALEERAPEMIPILRDFLARAL